MTHRQGLDLAYALGRTGCDPVVWAGLKQLAKFNVIAVRNRLTSPQGKQTLYQAHVLAHRLNLELVTKTCTWHIVYKGHRIDLIDFFYGRNLPSMAELLAAQ